MSHKQLDNILESFDPISLEEMDSVRLMNRQDTKFIFSLEELIEILPLLNEHYRLLNIDGKRTSKYETVYFDTENLDLYIDHHRQKVDRYKVRYRKYLDTDLAFLEVKHKFKGRTDKKRILVDDLLFKIPGDHEEFVRESGVENAEELESSLHNNFERITLVARERAERLTLDINLEFEDSDKKVSLDDLVIAELKQEETSRLSPFYKILKKKQIRPFRISKYCIGLIKMKGKGNIKYNRFKKKLIKIKKLTEDAA